MSKIRAHIYVTGKVQGVFFRQNTKRQAQSRGVCGWVSNLSDGRVEAVFEGEDLSVKEVIDFCHHGPSFAKVEHVEVSFEDYTGDFLDFRIV
ncbi:MAG: acylphosphatase [Nitrososphaerota archaeon]|jgi:acylphosphatase|uniref:acylphosphatase n=1 Tax=Candidatus Bathycorpusculum sp. TaxID=2994959 RepID=UPI002820BF1F|nr:acylphosphatase [Candidatus Termiticorpusculum sp.]MCL2257337.1 acylphosphatase [Candidatus Termiticorpusculum sp.]MCL2292546.1 acylphosphatase [Candidatus Termiticorpusculum sp.]MDR0461423.1 acylphosphatase [Nitrososphaerota archaeon]